MNTRTRLWLIAGLSLLALLALLTLANTASVPQRYTLDAAASNVSAKVPFFGLASKTARFPQMSGRIALSPERLDTIDLDVGYRGLIQYVIGVQKTSGNPDSMIELDSANALETQTPRTWMRLANFTFVHKNPASGNTAAMLFRGAADASLVNGLVVSSMACLRRAQSRKTPSPAALRR